jgi:hypothetical protein
MIHFASLQASIEQFFKRSSRLVNHKNTLRALVIALLVSAPLLMPRTQRAQDDCAAPSSSTCYTQPKRDIAFLIDATGSVEQRGQTYNIQVEGVRRAISDPTIIPRDGSVAVAVIIFNEAAQVAVPLTDVTDEATAKQIAATVNSLKCGNIHSHIFPCPFGATLYAPAIMAADIEVSRVRNANPKPGVTRAFVLSSDGLTNDLGAALKQVETARVASIQANIPFELDFLVLGEDPQSPDFSTALGTANELVTPKPANDLPGESFVITTGPSNVEGASATDPDIARQATDFAETVRKIVRGQVATQQPVVNNEADTAPGAAIGQGSVSLRQAIELANCNGGATNITFAASLKDKTIHLISPLPGITAPDVTINGCTIVDGNCVPSITIDGGNEISDGIVIRSNRVLVRGMKITNFTHAGVLIAARCPQDQVGHNRIEQNVIDGSPNGIVVLGDTNLQNKLSQNAISRPTPSAEASPAALIDLSGDGPTPNDDDDSDSGPNTLLNFPDAMLVTAQDSTVTVRGLLDNPPASGATVEIFGVTRYHLVDDHIVIDGVIYLGQTAVNDKGEFAATGLTPSPTGVYTATVTDLPGNNPADQSANTSELMIDTVDSPLPHSIADVPASVAFGDVTLNTPTTKPVTINNPGSAPLKVTGCTIGRCPNASSDNRERFAVANCPTAVINPGESATVNVTVNATACGALTACLLLQTDDPRRPQVAVELTANATSPAKAVIQDGVTQLKFKRQPARGSANPNPPTKTFTVTNTGCQPLVLNAATFTRGGQADTSGVFKISPSGQVTIPPGGSQTFTVSFDPVIPRVGGGKVPASITDTLTIPTNTGTPVTLTILGVVKPPIRFINPTDPSAQPVVTLCKNGDEFIVTFSAYDANTNLSRAVYQFKDSQGRNVGAPITVDNLGSVLQQEGIQEGQSFTLSQRFSGANDNKSVATVEVTIFDGETSDKATSTPLGSNCSGATLQSSRVMIEAAPPLVTDRRRERRH